MKNLKLKNMFTAETGIKYQHFNGWPMRSYTKWLESKVKSILERSDNEATPKFPTLIDVMEDEELERHDKNNVEIVYYTIKKLGNFS